MSIFVSLELISVSPKSLKNSTLNSEENLRELFDMEDDEEITKLEISKWEKRRELYPDLPPGPGCSDLEDQAEDEGVSLSAIRYTFHVPVSCGSGEAPNLERILEASEDMDGVRVVMSYLYHDLDDAGIVGFVDIANGSVEDEESMQFDSEPEEFFKLSRNWLGWEFPESP